MGTMIKVFVAVLVAAICVYFVIRTPQSEPALETAVESPAADVELLRAALEDLATDVLQRSPLAVESPVGESAVTGTKVLRVVLEGITEENAQMTAVTLTGVDERKEWPADMQGSWHCLGLTSEFDLDPFFASVADLDGDLRLDELEVHIDHPLHLTETIRVPLSSGVELESGQTIYEVRLQLVPAAVIHGRLVREGGTPVVEGLVGALLLEGDFPVEEIAGVVECTADGIFEFRLRASGVYALASYEQGLRPTTTRVEVHIGTRVDAGAIVLEFGHAITGQALRQGNPLAGASVSATPPFRQTAADPDDVNKGMDASLETRRTFTTSARSVTLVWLAGRFELLSQWVYADESGAFAFGGLGPGEYRLRMGELAEAHDSVPGYWDGGRDELFRIHGRKPALVVRAPKQGVVLEFSWTSIRFELAGDLESEGEGRLILKTPSGSPTPVDATGKDLRLVADPGAQNLNFTPEFFTTDFQLSGDEPTFVLQAPPNMHMTGEVAFPGRQPVSLDFWTPEHGGEIVVPIQLVRAENLATMLIELENPQAEIPDVFAVKLWRIGQEDFPPDTRSVKVVKGQLQVEGIFPGKYRVGVRAGADPYSVGLFLEYEFDLELHPDRVVTKSIMMLKGTRLEDLSPEFHQAVASLLKWHKQERGQVPMYSIRHPIYFDAIIQSGGMWPEKLQLMTSLFPSEQADEISIAFAHVAYFSWTSATGFADAMLPEIIWDFLDAKYPIEDQQDQIVEDWKPEVLPQAMRFASDVVTHFKIAQVQLVEDLVLCSQGNTEQAVENEYALLSSTTERILLGCRQGATPEETALLFQPLLDTDLSYLVEFNQRIFRSVPVIRNHD